MTKVLGHHDVFFWEILLHTAAGMKLVSQWWHKCNDGQDLYGLAQQSLYGCMEQLNAEKSCGCSQGRVLKKLCDIVYFLLSEIFKFKVIMTGMQVCRQQRCWNVQVPTFSKMAFACLRLSWQWCILNQVTCFWPDTGKWPSFSEQRSEPEVMLLHKLFNSLCTN